MYKILFLEDRTDRQTLFLPNGIEDIERINSIINLKMPDPNSCKKIIEEINSQNYTFDNDLELIIVHRSILKTNGITYLNSIAKQNNIKLVFFSGGISQVVFNNDGFEQIFLNSTEFYSDLLIPFLINFSENSSTSVLELFHKNWKMSYLMLHRQLTENLVISKIDDTDPYTYYNLTKERLKQIEEIIGTSDAKEINKLIKTGIYSI